MAMKNPFSRIFAAIRHLRADPSQMSGRFFGSTDAGVAVNTDAATKVAAVWACMDAIAAPLASSDWNVLGGFRGDERKTALPRDALQYLLNTRWNPEMTAQSAKRAIMLAATLGNGYAEIERDLANRIIGLWPIPPETPVEPRRDEGTGELFYRCFNSSGGYADLRAEDVLHIRGPGMLGFMGDDMVVRAIRTIGQAIAMEAYTSAYFGNNAQLGTVFLYKNGKLDDTHYSRMKEQLEARHAGPRKAFRSALLDGGEWDVKTIGSNAEQSQIIAARHLSIEDIARFFRVPLHKVQHLLRATNNNVEHQGLEFTRDTLRSWVKECEQEADFKLIPYRGPPKFVEIDVDWAEQGDYKSRMEAYQIARGMGVFSANDILRKLGENTIGEEGDIRIVQGANVKLEDVGAAYGANGNNNPALPAPDESDESDDEEDDEEDDSPESEDASQAWLRSVYARIERRRDNREAELEKAGHKDATARARSACRAYAVEQVEELAPVLGAKRLANAKVWAEEVINGCAPSIAAAAVFQTRSK